MGLLKMNDTKVYTTTINDVRYRFNGLILQFDYNGLYKILIYNLKILKMPS